MMFVWTRLYDDYNFILLSLLSFSLLLLSKHQYIYIYKQKNDYYDHDRYIYDGYRYDDDD